MADQDKAQDFEIREVKLGTTADEKTDRLPLEDPPSEQLLPETSLAGGEVKPYVKPKLAAVSIIPKRVVEVTGPAPYEAVKITLWINPPDGEVNARASSSKNLGEYMTHFIMDWSLTDEDGEKLPINEASVSVFPKDLWDWLIQEFGEARTRPLVPPKNDTTANNRTPRQMNPNHNQNLNGSTG